MESAIVREDAAAKLAVADGSVQAALRHADSLRAEQLVDRTQEAWVQRLLVQGVRLSVVEREAAVGAASVGHAAHQPAQPPDFGLELRLAGRRRRLVRLPVGIPPRIRPPARQAHAHAARPSPRLGPQILRGSGGSGDELLRPEPVDDEPAVPPPVRHLLRRQHVRPRQQRLRSPPSQQR